MCLAFSTFKIIFTNNNNIFILYTRWCSLFFENTMVYILLYRAHLF